MPDSLPGNRRHDNASEYSIAAYALFYGSYTMGASTHDDNGGMVCYECGLPGSKNERNTPLLVGKKGRCVLGKSAGKKKRPAERVTAVDVGKKALLALVYHAFYMTD